MFINRKQFFETIKVSLFKGKLSQKQVEGIDAIFDTWEESGFTDLRWLAYMLGTAFHETAFTMQPIEEYGKGRGLPYGKKIKYSRIAYLKPDKLYYGRGYVQLTWYENYDKMGRLLKVPLLEQPELALDPHIAARIMFEGMTKSDSMFGDFTGKCLEMYFNSKTEDWINARRIINGLDKAKSIANYGLKFYEALKM